MIKLKQLLTEKKELDAKIIKAVAKMTDSNAHTHARIELSQALRNKKLEKAYRGLADVAIVLGYDSKVNKLRSYVDLELEKQLRNKFSNFDEIWGAL